MTTKALTALETLLISIDVVGLDHTVAVLQETLDQRKRGDDARTAAEFVLDMVARTTKIPVKEIRRGVLRRIDRRYSIGFCAYYLHSPSYFSYTMKMVSGLIGSSASLCYKYSMLIRNLDPTKEADRRYLQWRNLFDRKVKSFLITQNPHHHE